MTITERINTAFAREDWRTARALIRRELGAIMKFVLMFSALCVFAAAVRAVPVPVRDERKEQQEAIDAIKRLGGKVLYDYQRLKLNHFNLAAKPKDPKAFHRVVSVSLRNTKTTDNDLKQLAKLPRLEMLDLTNTRITGAGLAHLKGLNNLRVLSLWKTRVDDSGLDNLKGLTKMRQLVLDETKVTDGGLVHLKGMTELEEWLGLTDTKVTDQGLQALTGFKKLKSLNLRRTLVTEDGVNQLRRALPKTDISFGP